MEVFYVTIAKKHTLEIVFVGERMLFRAGERG
jgi:hypothetical protein